MFDVGCWLLCVFGLLSVCGCLGYWFCFLVLLFVVCSLLLWCLLAGLVCGVYSWACGF